MENCKQSFAGEPIVIDIVMKRDTSTHNNNTGARLKEKNVGSPQSLGEHF